jgi:nucleotide-binding universal stress UspA family protein
MRVSDLMQRLRNEFTEMPGLRLTEPQVERLCAADESTSSAALEGLVDAGFLSPISNGGFGRADLIPSAARDSLARERARLVPSPWRRILCIVDLENDTSNVLSTTASSALRYATSLAVTHRARITALQVISSASSQPASASVRDALRKSVFGEPFRGLMDVQVAFGSRNEEVTRVAKEIGADLIVIGRQGRADDLSLSRLCEVLRQAPCPVLIVHPSGRAAVA